MAKGSDHTELLQGSPELSRLKGRYEVLGRIGAGGMAEVHKGRDTVLKREVAIKILLPKFAEDDAFTQRFQTEAQAAAQLKSPHTVSVYDAGRDGDRYFIVMELVHGRNLKRELEDVGRIPPRAVVLVARQVCAALKEAHSLGIVHRDVKSSNIMVTRGERGAAHAQIMDFGIAQAAHLGDASLDKGLVLGTARYMSPEQAAGGEVDSRSDLYSLGVVMYEAATGILPQVVGASAAVPTTRSGKQRFLDQQRSYIAPRQLCPDIDEDLNNIIVKAMSPGPADRFASAAEMQDVLDSYLAVSVHPRDNRAFPGYWAVGFLRAPDGLAGTFRKVTGPCVLGRGSEADIVVNDPSVSRKHVRLVPHGMFLEVQDLLSSNGTLLDGELLQGSALCTAGSTLDLGNVRVRIGKEMKS